ncbi:MAG TPA: iron-sulfur cluster assembly protein [Candidatus Binatia bacterium]|nr:iron-sulfur cluster assembly protein [Candidatus Binatia bacterium]
MTAALVLFGLAGVALLGWTVVRRLRAIEVRLSDLRVLRRELGEARGDLERGLAVTRAHLAATISGEPPPRDVVLRGGPFRDVEPAEAMALLERTPDLFVLDVRTPAEYAQGHIPGARLIPLDELEDRLGELPARGARMLVTCAAGGRSAAACETLGRHGWIDLLNLAGGMHRWPGPREADAPPPAAPTGTRITYRGGPVGEAAVVAAIRECYDPEIPVNIYDLGLVYAIDIDPGAIAVRMTLTSEACPSARTIPEDVRRRVAALGQANVQVEVVWDPPWHPSRISPEGRQRLGLA